MTRVYVDTNIVSRLTDWRVSDVTAEALRALSRTQAVKWVTSAKTRDEVRNTRDPKRSAVLEFLVALFESVPNTRLEVSGVVGEAMIGEMLIGGSWTHPSLEGLRKYFDHADAEHLARASLSKCDYFLTLDESTILKPARANEPALSSLLGGMKLVSPVELAEALARGSGAA